MNERPSKLTSTRKKNDIVETAYRLFKENGFYATGVDQIMREAKVSKRTLYNYFPTKNQLIVAVLDHYRKIYKERLALILDRTPGTARERIRAIFEDAATWFEDADFHGCLAVNAMGEFSGKDRSIENACMQFKQWEIGVLRSLCEEIDPYGAEQLAFKLFVLLEGMSSIAQVTKGRCPVDMTAMAESVIESH
ncbi:MAG: TetR/AcrR family transcriptional regulator [Gammaproteobacteria bacterium]